MAVLSTLIVLITLTCAPATQQCTEQGPKQQEQQEVKVSGVSEIPSRGKLHIQGRELVIEATSYTHTGYKTFTGTWPREGWTIAVDPKIIPLGSRVHIEGLGWRVAEDKIPEESIAKGAVIDIFMDSEKRCWKWGRQDVRVVVERP